MVPEIALPAKADELLNAWLILVVAYDAMHP
jgi:hypothetical protein